MKKTNGKNSNNQDIQDFIPKRKNVPKKRLFSPSKAYTKQKHDPSLSGYRLVKRERDKYDARDSKGFFVVYEGLQSPIYHHSIKGDASMSYFPQLNQDLSGSMLSPVRTG